MFFIYLLLDELKEEDISYETLYQRQTNKPF